MKVKITNTEGEEWVGNGTESMLRFMGVSEQQIEQMKIDRPEMFEKK